MFNQASANSTYDNTKGEGRGNTRNEAGDCKIGDDRKNERELKLKTSNDNIRHHLHEGQHHNLPHNTK